MSSCATTFHHIPNVSYVPSGTESPPRGLRYPPIDGPTSPVRLLASSDRGRSGSAIKDQPTTRGQRNRSEPLSPQWPQSAHQRSSLRYHEQDFAGLRISDGCNQGQTFASEHETKDESHGRDLNRRSRDPEKASSAYSEDQDSYPRYGSHAHYTIDRHGGDGANDGAGEHSVWILVRAC